MIHLYLEDKNSYGCNLCSTKTGILLQLNETQTGTQVRVLLTTEEALEISEELQRLVSLISDTNKFVDLNKLK